MRQCDIVLWSFFDMWCIFWPITLPLPPSVRKLPPILLCRPFPQAQPHTTPHNAANEQQRSNSNKCDQLRSNSNKIDQNWTMKRDKINLKDMWELQYCCIVTSNIPRWIHQLLHNTKLKSYNITSSRCKLFAVCLLGTCTDGMSSMTHMFVVMYFLPAVWCP